MDRQPRRSTHGQHHRECGMSLTRCGLTLALAGLITISAWGQTDPALILSRRMLAEDNPGELWVERGKELWHLARGPLKRSLEQCDLGLGAAVVDGAFARLPRYFPDTGRV